MSPWDEWGERRRRIPADGIRAKSQRGEFGASWWAKRWIGVLEGFGWGNRLQRGRSYARNGSVLSLDVGAGKVAAKVQGSRPAPYRVTIGIAPLSDAQWERAIGAMAEQAIFAAKLLAGEMPQDIEEAFKAAGVPLFPHSARDLATTCSCPDAANPCKHIAAVYYLLGERFDEDPFLLFALRGRDREQIGAALGARRAAAAGPSGEAGPALPPAPPLESLLETFFQAGDLDAAQVPVAPPQLETPHLRRLGVPPADAHDALAAAYRTMTAGVLERVFGAAADQRSEETPQPVT